MSHFLQLRFLENQNVLPEPGEQNLWVLTGPRVCWERLDGSVGANGVRCGGSGGPGGPGGRSNCEVRDLSDASPDF